MLRFDLLANGGASLTLSYERAPFPTLHRTVWLPWNVFHVMDTVVMKREENDIPSCYLTGLIRPNPLILATPLSTLYKSSPEDSPIIPETQVRQRSQRWPGENALQGFYGQFQICAHIWCFSMTLIIWPVFDLNITSSSVENTQTQSNDNAVIFLSPRLLSLILNSQICLSVCLWALIELRRLPKY